MPTKCPAPRIPVDCHQVLWRTFAELDPATVLLVGEQARGVLREMPEPPRYDYLEDTADVQSLDALDRYDIALIAPHTEVSDRSRVRNLIARVRDVHSRLLLLLVPGEQWAATDLLGLGMEHVMSCRAGPRTLELLRYNIRDYKTTPDWLNSRYWAHPELFDKYRW
jgi:hypothetical protein